MSNTKGFVFAVVINIIIVIILERIDSKIAMGYVALILFAAILSRPNQFFTSLNRVFSRVGI